MFRVSRSLLFRVTRSLLFRVSRSLLFRVSRSFCAALCVTCYLLSSVFTCYDVIIQQVFVVFVSCWYFSVANKTTITFWSVPFLSNLPFFFKGRQKTWNGITKRVHTETDIYLTTKADKGQLSKVHTVIELTDRVCRVTNITDTVYTVTDITDRFIQLMTLPIKFIQ